MGSLRTWQQVLETATQTADSIGLLQKFRDIKEDNAGRVELCLENSAIREHLTHWIEHCAGQELFLFEGQADETKLREEGNKLFAKHDYVKSVVAYSRSIKMSTNDKNRSLALANRSAALFHLKMFRDSIEDIDRALQRGYPANLTPKILLRKAKCLQELGVMERFNQTLQELKEVGDEKLLREVEELGKLNVKPANFIDEHSSREPEPLDGTNTEVPGMSAALQVSTTETKGRYVITQKKLSGGDTLFVERPFASVILPDFQQTHCHVCVSRLSLRYVCLDCGEAWFCSYSCREVAARTFHQYECGKLSLLNSIGIAHLGLRVLLTAGVDKLLGGEDVGLLGPEYLRVYNLVTHAQDMESEELFQYTLTAALLTEFLESQQARVAMPFPNDSKYWISGLILRHVTQLVCNAHAITDICSSFGNSATQQLQQERIATAIYPSASMMNHSCDPTIINSFQGNLLIVRSIKDVPAGGEIFNCYGPHFRRMSRRERIGALQSQYNFSCDCWQCADETLEDFQEYISSFRCPECGGPLRNPDFSAGAKSQPSQTTICRQCKKLQIYLPQLTADLEAIGLEKQGAEAMENGDMRTAITCLKRCVELRLPALYKGHPDLGTSADRLAQCLANYGFYTECSKYLEISLKCVEEQYGRFSVEFANELQKITDVYLGILNEGTDSSSPAKKQLKLYLKEAALVYSTCYGPWSKDYLDIVDKMKQIRLER